MASDSDGVFTIEGLKTGKAKVTITLHSGLSASFTVKVRKKAVKTTEISGLPEKVTLTVGEQLALEPVVVPATSLEGVTYKSSKEKVAAVSDDGIITAVKAGKAKITVKSGSKKFVVTVKVTKQ
ncbi:MAG: Ig-like domain-containing protein [Lachnospiraceae bacterium]|nr:Ig-like domain-containing protein [Lachnospiraceae bacterium]